jgi:signal peptidase I
MTDDLKPRPPDPIAAGPPPLSPQAVPRQGNAAEERVSTTPRAQVPVPPRAAPSQAEHKDGSREIVETIVFVVVLVLLLKTFLAEAFVIPTGSMAVTLLGYHKAVVCDDCKYPFRVNASDEVERRPPHRVVGYTCPNCGYHKDLTRPPILQGGAQP